MVRTPNMAVGIDLNVPIAVRTAEGTQDDVITLVHDAFGLTDLLGRRANSGHGWGSN
jgi:hypothetical protein